MQRQELYDTHAQQGDTRSAAGPFPRRFMRLRLSLFWSLYTWVPQTKLPTMLFALAVCSVSKSTSQNYFEPQILSPVYMGPNVLSQLYHPLYTWVPTHA